MMSSVPQFINVEDKIAGPLTWRQLLWMIGMGATLFVVYRFLGLIGFFIIGVPIIVLFSALAFYRPQGGQSLINFFFHGIIYFFKPKVAVWERPATKPKPVPANRSPLQTAVPEKHITAMELRSLARILDRRS